MRFIVVIEASKWLNSLIFGDSWAAVGKQSHSPSGLLTARLSDSSWGFSLTVDSLRHDILPQGKTHSE